MESSTARLHRNKTKAEFFSLSFTRKKDANAGAIAATIVDGKNNNNNNA